MRRRDVPRQFPPCRTSVTLRQLALALLLLLRPAIAPAEVCPGALERTAAAAPAGVERGGEHSLGTTVHRALLGDGAGVPELRTATTAGDAPARQGDVAPPGVRASVRFSTTISRAFSNRHRDALALRFREHLSYDATAPPLG